MAELWIPKPAAVDVQCEYVQLPAWCFAFVCPNPKCKRPWPVPTDGFNKPEQDRLWQGQSIEVTCSCKTTINLWLKR